jgi:hypothetical protein
MRGVDPHLPDRAVEAEAGAEILRAALHAAGERAEPALHVPDPNASSR